jgi:hypothetical protein
MSSTPTNRFLEKIPLVTLCESSSDSEQRSQVFLAPSLPPSLPCSSDSEQRSQVFLNDSPSISCEDLRELLGRKHARDEQSVASYSQSLPPHSSQSVPSSKRAKRTGAAGIGEVGANEPQVCAEVDKSVSINQTAEETELRTRMNESPAAPIGARATGSLEGVAGFAQGQMEQLVAPVASVSSDAETDAMEQLGRCGDRCDGTAGVAPVASVSSAVVVPAEQPRHLPASLAAPPIPAASTAALGSAAAPEGAPAPAPAESISRAEPAAAGAVDSFVLDSFQCPVTMEVMIDPVITADGHTYERKAIEKWFERGGSVTSITMTCGGSGYTSPPTISFTGGGGTGASAVVDTAAILSTSVSTVKISASGSGYKSAPTVVFTGGGGSGASATAIVKMTSPKTGAELLNTNLIPNIALRNAIEESESVRRIGIRS